MGLFVDKSVDIDAGRDMEKRHEKLAFFHGDVAQEAVLAAFAATLPQPANFLINNACIGRGRLLAPCSYADFEYVQRVGVTAPYYLTSLLLQNGLLAQGAPGLMRFRRGGLILLVMVQVLLTMDSILRGVLVCRMTSRIW